MSVAGKTTDHDVIRRRAEGRGAHPARVEATGDFPGQDATKDGEESRFNRFVRR